MNGLTEAMSKPEVIWFLIGLLLLALELIAPGLILVFFGVGAWLTAAFCLIADPDLGMQLLVFGLTSFASLLGLRRLIKKQFFDKVDSPVPVTELDEELIGHHVEAISSFKAGELGKVRFKGAKWDAYSEQDIQAGQLLEIESYSGIRLKVKPIAK